MFLGQNPLLFAITEGAIIQVKCTPRLNARKPVQLGPIKILHLDDDALYLEQFAAALTDCNDGVEIDLRQTTDQIEYFEMLAAEAPDVVVLDVNLAGKLRGPDVAIETRRVNPKPVIFMCSDHKGIGIISSCISAGADDFIFKGNDERELVLRFAGALRLRRPNNSAATGPRTSANNSSGATMQAVRERLTRITSSAVTAVHVNGESGTGKELVADCLAGFLPKGTPFIRVNCGAISPTLLESELFGHTKGAFTGAMSEKAGLVEAASGGWLFLDEVALLSVAAQISLLRVLESHTVRRVGDTRERPVNIRVLSATNDSIPALVKAGKFREDLWQRLQEAQISLPPLRARMKEIPDLVRHFLQAMQGGPYEISDSAMEILCSYDWHQGNVRELRNCLRSMTEMSIEKLLTPLSLNRSFWERVEASADTSNDPANEAAVSIGSSSTVAASSAKNSNSGDDDRFIKITWPGDEAPEYERLCDLMLLELLKREYQLNGKVGLRNFARMTGIPRSTLSTRMRHLVDREIITLPELTRLVNVNTN